MPLLSHVVDGHVSSELRLDRYVSEILRLFSRSQIKARGLKARVNGKDVKLSRIVKNGDILVLSWEDTTSLHIIPQNIPLDIIYEDEKCVVINKAQGMVVHPGAGNKHGTLANALLFRRQNMVNRALTTDIRPGIVHRLDKETSGVIIASYDDETHSFLSMQFKSRKVRKIYIAVVCGIPIEKTGRIETFIARDSRDRKRFTVSANGKTAITFYKVAKYWQNYALVLLSPKTGRTHQLRAHMRYLGYPVLGDSVYGYKDKYFPDVKLMLHSKSLEITLPGETQARVFTSPLPKRYSEVFEKLNSYYRQL
jgi:23S rRNA pseudouridine1911/1915/1917 synthase